MPNRPATHKPLRSAARQHRTPDRRPTAHQRGYGSRWQDARQRWLQSHPTCAECQRRGRATPANVVDHITPHRGDWSLFWDCNNWQSLCQACHNVKTGRGE